MSLRVRTRALALGALVAAPCWLSGCGSSQSVCESNCPDISGAYALTSSTPLGSCAFRPLFLGPNIVLTQSTGSGEVQTQVLDPIQKLPLPLAGSVVKVEDKKDVVAGFSFDTRTSRQAVEESPGLVSFDLRLSGNVVLRDGKRQIAGQLIQTELFGGTQSGCATTLTFGGVAVDPQP